MSATIRWGPGAASSTTTCVPRATVRGCRARATTRTKSATVRRATSPTRPGSPSRAMTRRCPTSPATGTPSPSDRSGLFRSTMTTCAFRTAVSAVTAATTCRPTRAPASTPTSAATARASSGSGSNGRWRRRGTTTTSTGSWCSCTRSRCPPPTSTERTSASARNSCRCSTSTASTWCSPVTSTISNGPSPCAESCPAARCSRRPRRPTTPRSSTRPAAPYT